MLELRDFFHLPEIEALIAAFVADQRPGLSVVAGLDPRPLPPVETGPLFLPSGRSAFFGMLVDRVLTDHPGARAIVVAQDKDALRIPRHLKRRIEIALVVPGTAYEEQIAKAARRRPALLVVDRLSRASAPAACEAAVGGLRVLAQLDSLFRGAGIKRQLLDLGVPAAQLDVLACALSILRLPALCPHCKETVRPDAEALAGLYRRARDLGIDPGIVDFGTEGQAFYRSGGCQRCGFTGRHGDVAAFDIFHFHPDEVSLDPPASRLPLTAYLFRLAQLGHLALEDVLDFERDEPHRLFNLLLATEQALDRATLGFQRKLAELEAANRVLQKRTRTLMSLEDISRALISSDDLRQLAARVCRQAHELCGADRAVLYYLEPGGRVEVLAANGWDADRLPPSLAANRVFLPNPPQGPLTYPHWPPGILPRTPDVEGAELRAGLYVPLVAQDRQAGVMVLHSTRKSSFTPGEVSLIQTLADHAALAIQRAGLVEQLRAKIEQLEAAQVELVKKERLEREMELARQVQFSLLPAAFPSMPGFGFAARYEPARQVSGDFYDVIPLDEDHFGLAIADVSDKGMPAALYMALTRSLLLAEARRERSPRAALVAVNDLLLALGQPSAFVTVFYGVVERSTGRLVYSCAGHDRPLLLRAGQAHELPGNGLPLGIFAGDEFHLSEEEARLEPGDRLVLYTDGLSDALTPAGEFYGHERLVELFRSHAGLDPDDLCAAVFADLLAYQAGADQYDDMALLVVGVE